MASHSSYGRVAVNALIFGYGIAFLILPASLFRLIFTTPSPAGAGLHFGRSVVGVTLFLMTSLASCLLYGQITN